MNAPLAALLMGLVVVALVHTRSRLLGSIGAATWCVGAMAYGAVQFQTRDVLVFLGLATRPWIYFAFITTLLLFNGAVIVRMLRMRAAGSAAGGKAPR
jgi:hypothetical protein